MKDQGKKNKHLTLEDRIEIQECLCKGMTFKAIGKRRDYPKLCVNLQTGVE